MHCFRYDPHTAYRNQAVGGNDQSHGHDHGHSHGHGDDHAMGQSDGDGQVPLRDDKWEDGGDGGGDGGGGGGGGSKEHAHRMIANIYPSE